MADDLWERPFVAFDTETTGLGTNARVIEIGAVGFVGATTHAAFQQLIRPGVPISPGAQQVHGLRDVDLAGSPPAEVVLPQFFAFVGQAPLVAHNAPFDLGMLARECVRVGLSLPANLVFDTRNIARALGLSRQGYSLGALVGALGIRTDRLHRALADAAATSRIFAAALLSAPQVRTLDDLIALAGPPRTFAEFTGELPPLPPALRCLEERLGRPVLICYGAGSKGGRPRAITPQSIFAQGRYVYVEAQCHLDGMVKVFRTDRIVSVEPFEG